MTPDNQRSNPAPISNSSVPGDADTPRVSLPSFRWMALALIVALAGLLYWQFRDELTLQSLAAREQQLKQHQADSPLLIMTGAFVLYVVVTGLSLPGASAMSLAYAWFFGFAQGLLLVSLASTTGASLAFLLSRFLLRDMLQARFADRLTTFNAALEREGPFYLFMLRLIALVPFWLINLVMGLTPMRLRTFWWVSQVGMLPGTIVYVYAGSSVPDLATLAEQGAGSILNLRVLLGFAVLGVFPLAAKSIIRRIEERRTAKTVPEDTTLS